MTNQIFDRDDEDNARRPDAQEAERARQLVADARAWRENAGELANLRSLLRSVTGKLEEAQGYLEVTDAEPGSAVFAAYRLIDSVLEMLA